MARWAAPPPSGAPRRDEAVELRDGDKDATGKGVQKVSMRSRNLDAIGGYVEQVQIDTMIGLTAR